MLKKFPGIPHTGSPGKDAFTHDYMKTQFELWPKLNAAEAKSVLFLFSLSNAATQRHILTSSPRADDRGWD